MASPLAKSKLKRRWTQLSLRTVLVLVTLLCIALSLWVVPAERQRETVAAIEKLGGDPGYVGPLTSDSFPAPFLRRWLPAVYRWLPPVYLDEIEYVDFDDTQVADAGLAHLQGLTGLRWLSFNNTKVTDAGLARLQGLTGLQGLHLQGTEITDAGLVYLHALAGLQELVLDDTKVTDAGLIHLQGLTDLQCLFLDGTQVTDAELAHLRKALPNCRITGP